MTKSIRVLISGFAIASLVVFGFTSCDDSGEKSKETEVVKDGENDVNEGPELIEFGGTVFSIPSPYQMAVLVKDLNLDYNKDFLNATTNMSKYTNNFKKALNLGVYGANLGYLNIYEQTPDAINYFGVIKKLSEDLDLLGAFDATTINRIETNMGNKDSLMFIMSNTYRKSDAYLKENDRTDVGALILAGGWIESLNVMCNLALQDPSQQEIIKRIAEQKNPLESMIKILSPFYNETKEYTELIEALIDLAYEFDGIDINYTYEAPEVDVDKKLTIINSKSEVVISDEQLKTITKKIGDIRKSIIE
ncbi:MAG: hypothetical protein JXR58_14065 [Bacteroidales bacterium]|nr:hypothetical protein [Bacteroidales bacterium]